MEKSKYGIFTFYHTLAYCLVSLLSGGAIFWGASHDNSGVVHFGLVLCLFWTVNPLGLLVPLIGLIRSLIANRFKVFFVLCIFATCASWLIAGFMVGSVL